MESLSLCLAPQVKGRGGTKLQWSPWVQCQVRKKIDIYMSTIGVETKLSFAHFSENHFWQKYTKITVFAKILAKIFTKITNVDFFLILLQKGKTCQRHVKKVIFVNFFRWHELLADFRENICFCRDFRKNICFCRDFRENLSEHGNFRGNKLVFKTYSRKIYVRTLRAAAWKSFLFH